MNKPGPMLQLVRVAAITLSLVMLAWFVYRSAANHGYRSVGSQSTNRSASREGSAANAASPALDVSARSIAPSSKSLDALITSPSSDPETVEINGRSYRRQADPVTHADDPVLAPSSKSLSQPIFGIRENSNQPTVMPGSKSAPGSIVETPTTPAPAP